MTPRTIVVLEGDQTGQELLEESLRVLHPDVTRVPTEFARYDLSLANRRATGNAVVHEAARAMAATGLGLKAATITPEGRDDVGSPNAILREEIDAAHARHAGVRYDPQLIDATLALLLTTSGEPLVIPTLNRDGDLLSDLVLQMVGSIAGAESLVLGFDDSGTRVRVVMAEAPHGTAPGSTARTWRTRWR